MMVFARNYQITHRQGNAYQDFTQQDRSFQVFRLRKLSFDGY
jgi:transposase